VAALGRSLAEADLVIPASPGGQKVLSDGQLASVRAWWSRSLKGPVRVQLYVDGAGCDSCEVTSRVLQQLQQASEKLHVSVALAGEARRAGEPFERLPETRVATRTGNTVRFVGTQVGVEVTSLVQTIADASLEAAPLPADLMKRARAVPHGSWVRVFVGPACTHCPGAVRSAVALALANPKLAVEVVGTADFPALARSFKVSAVPTTVVNGRSFFVDPHTPAQVLEALQASPPT
jgi:alkyl hydroperoxide reductase subunit AhpF